MDRDCSQRKVEEAEGDQVGKKGLQLMPVFDRQHQTEIHSYFLVFVTLTFELKLGRGTGNEARR